MGSVNLYYYIMIETVPFGLNLSPATLNSMIFGNFLNLSKPRCPHLETADNNSTVALEKRQYKKMIKSIMLGVYFLMCLSASKFTTVLPWTNYSNNLLPQFLHL